MNEKTSTDHREKIRRVAGRLKIAVWIFCGVIVSISVVGLFFEHASVTLDKELMNEEASIALQAISLFPYALFDVIYKLEILIVCLFMFWLQRLLGLFERGEYFSNQSVGCCLWIAWLFVIMLVIPAMQKGYLYYLSHRFLPDMDIRYSIEVELGSLVLIILLPMIIYMLRIAQTLELENKEFV